jgi:Sulfotransferase family
MEDYKKLIDVAKQETGLSEFGGSSFREGLEILVSSLNREARLNALGDRALRERIIGHLKQRLQVESWYERHPEIADVEILAPLFGLSLPRTGSTALAFLLACDPNVRFLSSREASAPCPPPCMMTDRASHRTEAGEVDREAGKGSHTPSAPDGPMECLDILSLDFKSQIFQAFALIPAYSDWLIDADLAPAYFYERRVLKLLQWRETPRPWRLKSPMHLLYLPDLDKIFPDARFVMTHRDPVAVILSVATVYADIAGHFTDELDLHYLGRLNVRTWGEGIRRAVAYRDRGNQHRFYDISFQDMQRDPVGQVRGLYDWLGEAVTPAFEANMAAWWKKNEAAREAAAKPDPARFGIDLDELTSLFSDYRARMKEWTQSRAASPILG